jgi:hypothetical protein
VKLAAKRNGLIKYVVGLFEDASRVSVLITGIVGRQSVFGHVIW